MKQTRGEMAPGGARIRRRVARVLTVAFVLLLVVAAASFALQYHFTAIAPQAPDLAHIHPISAGNTVVYLTPLQYALSAKLAGTIGIAGAIVTGLLSQAIPRGTRRIRLA